MTFIYIDKISIQNALNGKFGSSDHSSLTFVWVKKWMKLILCFWEAEKWVRRATNQDEKLLYPEWNLSADQSMLLMSLWAVSFLRIIRCSHLMNMIIVIFTAFGLFCLSFADFSRTCMSLAVVVGWRRDTATIGKRWIDYVVPMVKVLRER